MRGFWWNCVLTAAWLAITGELTLANAVIGFAIGTVLLMVAGRAIGAPGYVETVWSLVKLIAVFLRELTLANMLVAHDLLTPRSRLRPGIIKIPLDAQTDQEIMLLANLLTLTPGTTSIDVSEDRSTLYLHVMYLDKDGPDKTREAVKRVMEARLLKVTR